MCIYRTGKRGGAMCNAHTRDTDTHFCSSHWRFSSHKIHYDLRDFLGDANALTHANAYACAARFWERHGNGLEPAFRVVELMCYLLDHEDIRDLAKTMRIPVRPQKMAATFDIVNVLWRVWNLSRDPRRVAKIRVIQRRLRARAVEPPTNDTDPFTLDPVTDIPMERRLRYRDALGKVYAFDIEALHDHACVHGNATNPFTRQPLPRHVCETLQRWGRSQAATNLRAPATERWPTPSVAFTEVCLELETQHYIMFQPQWFMELSRADIYGVIFQFRFQRMFTTPYLDRFNNADYDATDMARVQYAFARDILWMLKEESAPSDDVFAFARCMAMFHRGVRETLPYWVAETDDDEDD